MNIIRAVSIPVSNKLRDLVIYKKLENGEHRIPPHKRRSRCSAGCSDLPRGTRNAGIMIPARPGAPATDGISPEPRPFRSGRCPSSRVFSANARTEKIIASIPSMRSEVMNSFRWLFIGQFSFTLVNITSGPAEYLERDFSTYVAALFFKKCEGPNLSSKIGSVFISFLGCQ